MISNKNIKKHQPLLLLIMDGWGISGDQEGNPLAMAKLPNFKKFWSKYPHTELQASGAQVGLMPGENGNSEAGHMNLGAGRLVQQDKMIIEEAIRSGQFYKNSAFLSATRHVKKNNSSLHLLGMISGRDSGHVQMSNLYALLKLAHEQKLSKVYLHLFTDGRDAPQHAASKYLHRIEENFFGNEKIASVCGRYYAMDRNKRWERTEAAYLMLTEGLGQKAQTAEEAIIQAYNRGETDEFIKPTLICQNGRPIATVKNGDAIIFFNLRSDRARQLTKAFVQDDFKQKNPHCFKRKKMIKDLRFVAMTDFGPDLDDILTAYPSLDYKDTLPMVLKDWRQVYIAETEKYAHLTFFFNGGYSDPVAGEDRVLISSPQIEGSYEVTPGMSTNKLTNEAIKRLKAGYDFIAVNFAAPDMIAHTGNFKAAVKAVEVCDQNLSRLAQAVLKVNGIFIVTSDHGNVESLINLKTKEVDTEHSSCPVPFIVISKKFRAKLAKGKLADVAPTILELLKVNKPRAMTGKSLIKK